MRKYITDNSGLRYYLKVIDDSDDSFYIDLLRKGDRVGYATYQRYPLNKEIVEAHIHIRDDADPHTRNPDYSNFPIWLKKNTTVTEINRDNKNYRHQGLGTKLLSLLIEHATERKVQRLYGSVMKADIDKTPRLVEWYEKHGFQRCSSYPGCIAGAAAYIFIDLT
jgi:ribosomal protein S18 acetylase RimI-like enzyme